MNEILIVEDEQDVIDLLALNFRKSGEFAISTAEDGALGLRKAREEAPAPILLDLMLPVMPGTGGLQNPEDRSPHSSHSDHPAEREGRGDRPDHRLGIWGG
jgi:DNA-binding response OmpR family regulator